MSDRPRYRWACDRCKKPTHRWLLSATGDGNYRCIDCAKKTCVYSTTEHHGKGRRERIVFVMRDGPDLHYSAKTLREQKAREREQAGIWPLARFLARKRGASDLFVIWASDPPDTKKTGPG